MEYTHLGETALRVSRICLGTWQFGGDWGPVDETEAVGTVREALDLGINFFDTAQAYGFGAAERLLGQALRDEILHRRADIVIATKGGLRRENGRLVRDASRESLRKGLDESLANLGTSYVDLYQVHWPDPTTPVDETAEVLGEFVREERVRCIGVSNFDARRMLEFERHRKLDSLQSPYDLFRRGIEKHILPYARAHGVGVLVYGALAHGLLAGRYTPETVFSEEDWRSRSAAFHGPGFRRILAVVERLEDLAREHGRTVAELAVAWTLAHPAVDVAIVGARRAEQIRGTAPAAEFHLDGETLRRIDRLSRGVVELFGATPEGVF